MKKNSKENQSTGSALGFEATLWATADKLRGNLDAAEYKHVVLGLIFLKYISDAFEERHTALQKEKGADPEDRDEYTADNIFWVPPEARWSYLQGRAKDPSIGKLVDSAMIAIEHDNPSLKGVLPKEYARPHLDKQSLGGVIDLIGTIEFHPSPRPSPLRGERVVGDRVRGEDYRSKDIIGRVYEYFLSEFASAEGKKGGQFYTPRCVVQLLVEMLAPYKGRVFDPCCGSGGMFVQSVEFVKAHANGNANPPSPGLRRAGGDISIFGQESNPTTWRLARMNLAIRSIEGNLGLEPADSFHRDLHKDLKADYILANPPFNISDWGGDRLREDARWKYGVPPASNANYAWVQHFLHHLAPTGVAGFVLANGSMSSNQSGEGEIRKAIIEADLVDCMVALPGQLFYSTQIPVCLWFLARNKSGGTISASPKFRDRRRKVLFLDARKMGRMIDRVQRDLTLEDIAKIAGTYHAWRGDIAQASSPASSGGVPAASSSTGPGRPVNPQTRTSALQPYEDIAGFCKSATLDEIRAHGHVLTPGRYVGAADIETDGEPFEQKMKRLTATLEEQFAESAKLEKAIRRNLEMVKESL